MDLAHLLAGDGGELVLALYKELGYAGHDFRALGHRALGPGAEGGGGLGQNGFDLGVGGLVKVFDDFVRYGILYSVGVRH